jgi:signal transduction histidine kinase/ActR/RegA family two-component response regulator
MMHASPELPAAYFWYRIGLIGAIPSTTIYMHYILELSTHPGKKKRRALYFLCYIFVIVFFVLALKGLFFTENLERVRFGWTSLTNSREWVVVLFLFYVILYSGISIMRLLFWYITEKERPRKNLALLLLLSILIPTLLNIPFVFFISTHPAVKIPEIGYLFAVILLIGFWIAHERYRLLTITRGILSSTVFENVSDILILIETDGTIAHINPYGLSVLKGYRDIREGGSAEHLFNSCGISFESVQGQMQVNNVFQAECNLKSGPDLLPLSIVISPLKNENKNLVGYLAICHDMTQSLELDQEKRERYAVEKSLREVEKLNKVVIDSLNDSIHVVDEQLRIVMHNRYQKEFLKKMNLDSDAVGKHVKQVFPFLPDNILDDYREVFQSGEIQAKEYTIPVAEERLFIVESVRIPIIHNSRVDYVLSIIRDVTEKRKQQHVLFQAEKIKSVGILAGGLAHDFNNIMVGIMGNLDLASLSVQEDDDLYDYIHDALHATQMAKGLAQQLLTFSRGGASVLVPGDIEELLVNTCKFVLSGSSISYSLAVDPELFTVDYDPDQLSSVFHNILLNAKQVSPPGSVVRVTAVNTVLEGDEAGLPTGNYVQVEITDQGPGIAEKDLERVFDPYFTTRDEGTGLGLSICYSVVKSHNGKIELLSKVGQGTTARIFLPASERVAAEVPADSMSVTTKGLRVLVMDDESVVLDLFEKMLGYLGCEVEITINGEEVLEKFAEHHDEDSFYDFIILDLTIPGSIGGRQTLVKLRDKYNGIKSIACSGYSDDRLLAEYHEFGFDTFLKKPFTIEELKRAIFDLGLK